MRDDTNPDRAQLDTTARAAALCAVVALVALELGTTALVMRELDEAEHAGPGYDDVIRVEAPEREAAPVAHPR